MLFPLLWKKREKRQTNIEIQGNTVGCGAFFSEWSLFSLFFFFPNTKSTVVTFTCCFARLSWDLCCLNLEIGVCMEESGCFLLLSVAKIKLT